MYINNENLEYYLYNFNKYTLDYLKKYIFIC